MDILGSQKTIFNTNIPLEIKEERLTHGKFGISQQGRIISGLMWQICKLFGYGSSNAKELEKLLVHLEDNNPNVRYLEDSGLAIRPVDKSEIKRLVHKAFDQLTG